MAGRQAHGRAPTVKSLGASKRNRRRKAKAKPAGPSQAKARAHDAFQIASELYPQVEKKTPRNRQLDVEAGTKHLRDDSDGDGDDVEEAPSRKRVRGGKGDNDGSDVEYGSDEEGNKWRLGGVGDEEDSEIESDDAFGESDEEKFQDFTFAGSKSKVKEDGDSEGEDDDDESLGEDAIDLATALDQAEEESSEGEAASESDDASEAASSDDDDSDTDMDAGGDGLKDLMSKYGADESAPEPGKPKKKNFALLDDEDEEAAKPTKPKIVLGDLGLTGISDPHMKKSLKLMSKEEKETRPGASKKLDVPLAPRQQERIDRKAAYEKTTETLDRWTGTIKRNRRADHLVFPLPQELPNAGLGNTEFQPLQAKTASTELEKTMFSLLQQSGLSLDKEPKKKPEPPGPDMQLSKELIRKHNEELVIQKRKEREMQSREAKKNARLKKIKSKAFHRVHRKQKQKDMQDGEDDVNSDDEREAQDRQRALERVGARHKNSAWAKSGSKVKRAVWDDDYRAGLGEMARRDQELRKRVEGRTDSDSEDESSDSPSESEDERDRLLRKVEEVEADDATPQNRLMNMDFMKRAEARIKKANDELVEQIKRDLNPGSEQEEEEEEGPVVGRKTYGPTSRRALVAAKVKAPTKKSKPILPDKGQDDDDVEIITHSEAADSEVSTWIKGKPRKAASRVHDLNILSNEADSEPETSTPKLKKSTSKPVSQPTGEEAGSKAGKTLRLRPNGASTTTPALASDSESGAEADSNESVDLLDPSDKLILEAFGGGDDVAAEFQKEKHELAEEQDDKVIDNTLPGWGSWVGDGVSAKEKRKHAGRFLQKMEGVKKKDRRDAKLEKVIINEKRIKKNERFLASQLPHPFETMEQYERSLRLPVGQEWVTKETFQDGTKPRVIVKQGIITPISRPII